VQGCNFPTLDLSAKGLGPSDLQFLSIVLTSFDEITTMVRDISLNTNPIFGTFSSYGHLEEADTFFDLCSPFLNAISRCGIKQLSLSDTGIGPAIISKLAALFTLSTPFSTTMDTLDISKNRLGSDGASALLEVIPASNLGTIIIGMKDPITLSVGNSKKPSGISQIDYFNQNLGPGELMMISTLVIPFGVTISSINVMKNPIGKDGLATLMVAVKDTSIKSITGAIEGQTSLDWSEQDLEPFDLEILGADFLFSPFQSTIRQLDVSNNPDLEFGEHDEGPNVLLKALKSTGLEILNLAGTSISAGGLNILANAIVGFGAKVSEVRLSFPGGQPLNLIKGAKELSMSKLELLPSDIEFWTSVCALFKEFTPALTDGSVLVSLDTNPIFGTVRLRSQVGTTDALCTSGSRMSQTSTTYREVTLRDPSCPDKFVDQCDAFLDMVSRCSIKRLSIANTGMGPASLTKFATSFTTFHSTTFHSATFAATLDELTLSSTCTDVHTAPRPYTLKGLQGTTGSILDLSEVYLGAEDLQFLSRVFTSFPKFSVTTLALDSKPRFRARESKGGVEAFCASLQALSMLSKLRIGWNFREHEAIALAHAISSMAKLNEVTLRTSGNMLYTICGLQEGTAPILNLQSLMLGPTDVQLLSIIFTSFPKFAGTLKSLDMSKNRIGDAGAQVLFGALKSTGIEVLNLAGINLGPTGVTMLADIIPSMTAVREIRLSQNPITGCITDEQFAESDFESDCSNSGDENVMGLAALCKAMQSSLVSKLVLSGCRIGPDGLSTLATSISDIPTLLDVHLSGNSFQKVSRTQMQTFCDAIQSSAVAELDVSCCGIGAEAGSALAKSIPVLVALIFLSVSDNPDCLSDEDAWRKVWAHLPQSRLEYLHLGGCNISNTTVSLVLDAVKAMKAFADPCFSAAVDQTEALHRRLGGTNNRAARNPSALALRFGTRKLVLSMLDCESIRPVWYSGAIAERYEWRAYGRDGMGWAGSINEEGAAWACVEPAQQLTDEEVHQIETYWHRGSSTWTYSCEVRSSNIVTDRTSRSWKDTTSAHWPGATSEVGVAWACTAKHGVITEDVATLEQQLRAAKRAERGAERGEMTELERGEMTEFDDFMIDKRRRQLAIHFGSEAPNIGFLTEQLAPETKEAENVARQKLEAHRAQFAELPENVKLAQQWWYSKEVNEDPLYARWRQELATKFNCDPPSATFLSKYVAPETPEAVEKAQRRREQAQEARNQLEKEDMLRIERERAPALTKLRLRLEAAAKRVDKIVQCRVNRVIQFRSTLTSLQSKTLENEHQPLSKYLFDKQWRPRSMLAPETRLGMLDAISRRLNTAAKRREGIAKKVQRPRSTNGKVREARHSMLYFTWSAASEWVELQSNLQRAIAAGRAVYVQNRPETRSAEEETELANMNRVHAAEMQRWAVIAKDGVGDRQEFKAPSRSVEAMLPSSHLSIWPQGGRCFASQVTSVQKLAHLHAEIVHKLRMRNCRLAEVQVAQSVVRDARLTTLPADGVSQQLSLNRFSQHHLMQQEKVMRAVQNVHILETDVSNMTLFIARALADMSSCSLDLALMKSTLETMKDLDNPLIEHVTTQLIARLDKHSGPPSDSKDDDYFCECLGYGALQSSRGLDRIPFEVHMDVPKREPNTEPKALVMELEALEVEPDWEALDTMFNVSEPEPQTELAPMADIDQAQKVRQVWAQQVWAAARLVMVRGVTGDNANFVNGLFELVEAEVYRKVGAADHWLFLDKNDHWAVGGTTQKDTRQTQASSQAYMVDVAGGLPPSNGTTQGWKVAENDTWIEQTAVVEVFDATQAEKAGLLKEVEDVDVQEESEEQELFAALEAIMKD
jgi:hypothetical protein